MKPSVGRVVHYVSHGTPVREDGEQAFTSECRAAVVTAVREDGDTADLAVLNPSGLFFDRSVEHDEVGHEGGTWHWPERQA